MDRSDRSRTPRRRRTLLARTITATALACALVIACGGPGAPEGDPGNDDPESPDLAAPTGLQARESDQEVHLSWSAVTSGDVTGYRVLRSDDEGANFEPERDVGTSPEATVTGLENGRRYRFAVAALGSDGSVSDPSEPILVSPFGSSPTPLVGYVTEDGTEYAVLADGQRFATLTESELTDPAHEEGVPWYDPAADALAANAVAPAGLRPAVTHQPDAFTLAALQTPIRFQGGRGTCQGFTALAAIEAEYKKEGYGDLDLSEQFANHLYRMTRLDTEPGADAVVHENTLGVRGGGNPAGVFRVLERYRVPEEAAAPYVSSENYEDTNQPGDVPRIDASDDTVPQREYNDWNLQDEETTYQIPGTITHTPFPRDALLDARHGITGYATASATDTRDPDWYKHTLYNFRSIAFTFCMRDTVSDGDGVWRPQGDRSASCRGHAVLIIGYDESDPDDPVFIAKNSWGGSDFLRLDPVLITDSFYSSRADVVLDVVDPTGDDVPPQAVLGRWDVVRDGEDAVLDVNRLPGFYAPRRFDGQEDRRLGAWFDAADAPHRVNGTVDEDTLEIEFHVDPADPALDYETLSGTRYTGYVSRDDPLFMAGTFLPFNAPRPYGFYAHKDGRLASVSGGAIDQNESYVGTWRIVGFGEPAYLTITSVSTSDVYTGRVTTDGGTDVSGLVDTTQGLVSVSLPDPDGDVGTFDGYVHTQDTGTISGRYDRSGRPGGLALVRTGPVSSVTIDTLGELRDGEDVQLGASVTDFPAETDVEIRWSYSLPGDRSSYTSFATTNDGEVFDASLPCDDLVIRAEAVDARSGLNTAKSEPLNCIRSTDTRMWHANRGLSGTVTDAGEVIPAETAEVVLVGDNEFDDARRGFLTFDWILPDDLAAIREAEIALRIVTIEGTPATDLDDLRAYRIDYGDSLDASDFSAAPLPGFATVPFDATTTVGLLVFDATDLMQEAWNERDTLGDRLQLQLAFQRGTDGDGETDGLTIAAEDESGTDYLPSLTVTYDAY